MSDRAGLLDSNVVMEALKHGESSETCRQFLLAVADGRISVVLDPIVVHELTYTIPRYLKGADRERIVDTLLVILGSRGALDPSSLLGSALVAWRDDPALSFADAYLGTIALSQDRPVYTLNRKDFERQGIDVPNLRQLIGTS